MLFCDTDLLWKMRPLLDGSQYLAYLEKLHELDCTLDSIRMLGKFPETHYNRWQEFEGMCYVLYFVYFILYNLYYVLFNFFQ